jgi:hypothetical protein
LTTAIDLEYFSTTAFVSEQIYARLNEENRKVRLAHSLLGDETWISINEKFSKLHEMSGEQLFRLKSVLRSMLILDSSIAIRMTNLFDSAGPSSTLADLIENAFIESHTTAGAWFINNELAKNFDNYDRLKDILVKITTANSFSKDISVTLRKLLRNTRDPDMRSMFSLALSNYSLKLKNSAPLEYEMINEEILQTFRTELNDTLQYLFLVGNSGYEKETSLLISLLSRYNKYDVVFAFRNFRGNVADSIIKDYILHTQEGAKEIASLFLNRQLDSVFSDQLISKIIIADSVQDSTFFPALQYLLDHRSERGANIGKLMTHSFSMPAYRDEVAEFINENQLCARKEN